MINIYVDFNDLRGNDCVYFSDSEEPYILRPIDKNRFDAIPVNPGLETRILTRRDQVIHPHTCPYCGKIYSKGLFDSVFHISQCHNWPWARLEDLMKNTDRKEQDPIFAFKLFRKKKNGDLTSLFINKKETLLPGIIMEAQDYPTEGYAHRPGWHCTAAPEAPHLSSKGRVWCLVQIWDYTEHKRPESQGGLWYTANKMLIIREL